MKLLLASPVGPLLAEYDAAGVRALRFWPAAAPPPAGTRDAPAAGDVLGEQLRREVGEYFEGERRAFAVPLAPQGTDFQRRVWTALQAIGWGETRSYGQLAEALGSAGAARAVGQANGRNPIAVLIPCHRVVAAGGRLGGYSGGTAVKQWLLSHERAGRPAPDARPAAAVRALPAG